MAFARGAVTGEQQTQVRRQNYFEVTMSDINERLVGDAVHVRAWLMQMDRGHNVILVPGSDDQRMLEQIVQHIEKDMRRLQGSLARSNRARVKEDAKPRSVYMRERIRKQNGTLRRQINKYFQIHAKQLTEDDNGAAADVLQNAV